MSYKGVRLSSGRQAELAASPARLERAASAFGGRRSVQLSYGEMACLTGGVKLRSVDARGRTWNPRLRRPVLCPLSYVDRVERGSGAVRTPEALRGPPGFKPGSSTIRIASGAGGVHRVGRREWDSNPRSGEPP